MEVEPRSSSLPKDMAGPGRPGQREGSARLHRRYVQGNPQGPRSQPLRGAHGQVPRGRAARTLPTHPAWELHRLFSAAARSGTPER